MASTCTSTPTSTPASPSVSSSGSSIRNRANEPCMSLFDSAPIHDDLSSDPKRPLAERMRPDNLDDYVGQEHILGAGKPLRAQIERDELTSLILWGPPGVGKTTLARLIARMSKAD